MTDSGLGLPPSRDPVSRLTPHMHRIQVTDFGLSVAKQETEVATGASLGSPQWTAPELLRGKPADECADIYSYGLLVYEVTAAAALTSTFAR